MVVTVDFLAPPEEVFGYLADLGRRPEWQASLRGIEALEGDGGVGTTWRDVTAVGARPRMEITDHVSGRTWAEVGRWRGVTARLRLDLTPVPGGTRVDATFDVTAAAPLRPAAWVLGRLAPYGVRSDLRRAARIVGSGPTKERT